MARTEALRKLKRAGYTLEAGTRWPNVLMAVTEDQRRGLPHMHGVLGHTTKIEKAYAKAFLDALPRAARRQGLGFSDRYAWATTKQRKYQATELRGYITKLARYPSKDGSGGGEFLKLHAGERVFYVAPWLSRLSGLTMTVSRLCRRVWAARRGYCAFSAVPDAFVPVVERLMGSLASASNGP